MLGLDLIIALFATYLLVKGIWKGFVKEIAGIIAVVAGIAVAFLFAEQTEQLLAPYIGERYLRTVAYVVLFMLTYILTNLLGNLLDKILRSIMLGGINRILGGFFGLLKALLWLMVLTYAYDALQSGIGFEHPSWIQGSVVYPFLIDLVAIAEEMLR